MCEALRPKLLPCPFCGGTKLHDLPKFDWVACQDCGAALEDVEPSARELWNKRAIVPVPGSVTIPKAALDWLFGSGPDHEGKWFGDREEEATPQGLIHPRPAYWWRSHLRKLIEGCSYE